MSSDPNSLPICGTTGGGIAAGGTAGTNFTVCAGTPGNLYGGAGHPGPVPNDEDADTRTYQNFFNSTLNPVGINPCISTFTPVAVKTDATGTTFAVASGASGAKTNTVGYVNGNGCCTRLADYTEQISAGKLQTLPPAANNRITRLSPFSTDIDPRTGTKTRGGAIAAANGVPPGLMGMTKIWGVTPGSWLHGGVHADNVGAWNAGPVAADGSSGGFLVKYGKDSTQWWRQQYVLWCRMTGDKYSAATDPYGTIFPAPPGSYITSKTTVGPKNVYSGAYDSNGMKLRNPCQGCSLDPKDGQLYVNPISKTPAQWNGGLGTSCVSPYVQDCNMQSLTDAICSMPDPSGVVPGMYNDATGATANFSYGTTGDGGFSGYTAEKRVGGCFTSEDMYGPGTFSVLVNLPPTLVSPTDFIAESKYPVPDATGLRYGADATPAPGMAGGRGYVFSMWTFSYSEAYLPPIPVASDGTKIVLTGSFDAAAQPQTDVPTRVDTSSTQYVDPKTGEMSANGKFAVPAIPGITSGDLNDGYYTIHNAEIDIEIPSNTGQVADVGAANQKQFSGLNTANFNTWVTDQDNDTYKAGTPTLYQQAQATAPDGQFFASVGPDDDESTYHEFSFVWYVDPKEESMSPQPLPTTRSSSYVAFLRDGVEIFKCHRFVPRRSGRVVIGMWPAWWGSIRTPMAFSQVYAKIARLEFTPQCDYSGTPFPGGGALVTNAPQLYDEVLPMPDGSFSEIKCGFNTPIKTPGAATYPPGTPFCPRVSSTSTQARQQHTSVGTSLAHSGKPHHNPKAHAPAHGHTHKKKKVPKWVLPVVVSVACVLVLGAILVAAIAARRSSARAEPLPVATTRSTRSRK